MRFLGIETGIETAGEEVSNAVVLFLSKGSVFKRHFLYDPVKPEN